VCGQIDNWPFCAAGNSGNPCVGDVGSFVDVGVSIDGASEAAGDGGDTVSGLQPSAADATLALSAAVEVDGAWEAMATGFPAAESAVENFHLGLGGAAITCPLLNRLSGEPCIPVKMLTPVVPCM